MTVDHRLIQLLVCPICKGPLEVLRGTDTQPGELMCRIDRLAFPIHDGIPVMLEQESRPVDPDAIGAPRTRAA